MSNFDIKEELQSLKEAIEKNTEALNQLIEFSNTKIIRSETIDVLDDLHRKGLMR